MDRHGVVLASMARAAISARVSIRALVGLSLLGLGAILVAACITEGCTFPYETGATTEIPFVLDQEHPVASSWIEVSLSADALPGDVDDRGARLQLTLPDVPGVSLTLVPEATGTPAPILGSKGVVSLPLDGCRADEPCTVRFLALVERSEADPAASVAAPLTVEGLVRVPHTSTKCGLPAGVVAVTATPPVERMAGASERVGEPRSSAQEIDRHVTVRFDGDGAITDPPVADPASPVVARGHVALTPDPDPPEFGPNGSVVPGMWLRVTPDDGGPPILDSSVPLDFPVLPANATFPIDGSCAVPCERGYWIQMAIFDPAHGSFGDLATAVFGWAFDASVSSVGPPGSPTVRLDAGDGLSPPAPLTTRGTGDPFRIDQDHPAATLVIDAAVPERSAPTIVDHIGEAVITFRLTTVAVDPARPGQLWLSNGHYLGDGSTADDDADTGASSGPSTVSSPPGRPFAACTGSTEPCTARTGLVQRRYDSPFDDSAPTPPYDVRWEWMVVGAPPGATITVEPRSGASIGDGPTGGDLAVVALIAGAVVIVFAIALVRLRRRRRAGTRPQ